MKRPGVNKKRGSLIELGCGVTLCSNSGANPVAEGGRCHLATLDEAAEIRIADNVGLSSVIICAAKHVQIGEGTIIGGGAIIMDTDFHERGADGAWKTSHVGTSMGIVIGKRCFIGARAILLKGVILGDDVVVGAGAVVTGKHGAGKTLVGNPARELSK